MRLSCKIVQQTFVQFSKSSYKIPISASGFGRMSSSTSSSFLQKVLAACPKPESVRIRDETLVADKILSIISGGPSALQVITDFDATLTRYHLNGDRCDSSYGIIAFSPFFPEESRQKSQILCDKYYPIELNPTMPIEDKIPHMIDWYNGSHECMLSVDPPMKRSTIQEMVAGSRCHLRDRAKESVERLSKVGVPLLVLSAGIGDIVQMVLGGAGIAYPNVKVISNFMEFDDGDVLVGFKEPLIHMFNKNEAAMHDDHSQHFDDLSSRHNVILLGDCLGDVNMDHGVVNERKTALKIGFLNAHIDEPEHLDAFMTAFDIVLVDDQSWDFLNLLLDHVLKGP